ncbi:hypothetical protein U1Q18_041272 [Sarracenia purpurea var. burkii]
MPSLSQGKARYRFATLFPCLLPFYDSEDCSSRRFFVPRLSFYPFPRGSVYERSELVLEEAIADKRAQRAVQLSGKICDLFERAYRTGVDSGWST